MAIVRNDNLDIRAPKPTRTIDVLGTRDENSYPNLANIPSNMKYLWLKVTTSDGKEWRLENAADFNDWTEVVNTIYDDTALAARVTVNEGDIDDLDTGKVDNSRVLTNVPTGAVFTDTPYNDTPLAARVTINEGDILDLQGDIVDLQDADEEDPVWMAEETNVPRLDAYNIFTNISSFTNVVTMFGSTAASSAYNLFQYNGISGSTLAGVINSRYLIQYENNSQLELNNSYLRFPDLTIAKIDDSVSTNDRSGVTKEWALSKIAGGQTSLPIEESPANHFVSGVTVEMEAGENVAFGDMLYLKIDGKLWKANAGSISTAPAFAMSAATIAADATGKVLLFGIATNTTWTLNIGREVYLSTTSGEIVQTKPTGIGAIVQAIGIATAAYRILLNPSMVDTLQTVIDTTAPATITLTTVEEL